MNRRFDDMNRRFDTMQAENQRQHDEIGVEHTRPRHRGGAGGREASDHPPPAPPEKKAPTPGAFVENPNPGGTTACTWTNCLAPATRKSFDISLCNGVR